MQLRVLRLEARYNIHHINRNDLPVSVCANL